jgi:hypothetical protein
MRVEDTCAKYLGGLTEEGMLIEVNRTRLNVVNRGE